MKKTVSAFSGAAVGVALMGLGLAVMNVRDNVAAFIGLVLAVGGLAMVAYCVTTLVIKQEDNDQ